MLIFGQANSSAKVEAARELVTVISISLAPFLIGFFAFRLIKPDSFPDTQSPLIFYLSAVFLRGQLFLYRYHSFPRHCTDYLTQTDHTGDQILSNIYIAFIWYNWCILWNKPNLC
ncbi:MAG: hypothetical protein JKP95_02800 [Oceanicaulis sp.]|nr:hypothetical protein [Oceanicaulis sp.]